MVVTGVLFVVAMYDQFGSGVGWTGLMFILFQVASIRYMNGRVSNLESRDSLASVIQFCNEIKEMSQDEIDALKAQLDKDSAKRDMVSRMRSEY